MVIDNELTNQAFKSQIPNTTTMTLFYRKGGVLLAIKIDKQQYGKEKIL